MMDSGKVIKCMALANSTTRTEPSLTRVSGKTMSSMGKGESTTWNLSTSPKSSTTKTSLSWETNGPTTMENSKMTQSMGRGT